MQYIINVVIFYNFGMLYNICYAYNRRAWVSIINSLHMRFLAYYSNRDFDFDSMSKFVLHACSIVCHSRGSYGCNHVRVFCIMWTQIASASLYCVDLQHVDIRVTIMFDRRV